MNRVYGLGDMAFRWLRGTSAELLLKTGILAWRGVLLDSMRHNERVSARITRIGVTVNKIRLSEGLGPFYNI